MPIKYIQSKFRVLNRNIVNYKKKKKTFNSNLRRIQAKTSIPEISIW